MNFIILADKYQKGMKSKGAVGLIKLNKKITLFEHQYEIIKSTFKKPKIIYIYGFDSKKVSNFFSSKKYNDVITIMNNDYENSNYSYSLSLANQYMDKDFFLIFGDAIFKKEMFQDFNRSDGSKVFINHKQKNKLGCILDNNQNVLNIAFDLENYLTDTYYISQDDASIIKSIVANPKYNNYFIFEIINKMIDIGSSFGSINKNQKNIASKIGIKLKVET